MKVLIHEWVTGGGLAGSPLPPSWAAEGRAMRTAIAGDFRRLGGVKVVATLDERFAAEEASEGVLRIGPGEEADVLTQWVSRCDYTVLIAPETGGVLEALTRLIGRAGGAFLGSTPEAVALTTDKRLLAVHLSGLGIRTPRTEPFDARSGLAPDFPHPVVVKPVDGAGSMHTYYCERAGRDGFGPDLPPEMVIQPFCPGTPMSATFLLGPDGSVVLVGVGRQELEIREGRFYYSGGRLPAPVDFALGEPLAAVRSVAGLRGVVGVDFIRDMTTGETTVIEINPRPTTSYVGWVRLLAPGTIARRWINLFKGRGMGDDLRGMIETATGIEVVFFQDGSYTEGAWEGS